MMFYRLILLGGATALLAGPLAAAPVPGALPAPGRAVRVATKPAATSAAHTTSVGRTSDPIVATVNGEAITESEWQSRLRLMAGKRALDSLVSDTILHQEARKNGVAVSTGEVAAKAAELEKGYRERFNPPAKFTDFLKQQGLSLASFRSAMRYSAEMQLLQQRLGQKLGTKVQVTDQELQDTYEKQKFQFVQPAEFKIAHIMVSFTGLDDAAQAKTKAEAEGILAKAKAPGADFAALAKEYSQDTDTKGKGGELPWMSFSPWGPMFDQTVSAAPVGLIDQPVRSYKGFHIVKVIDKHPQKTRTFDEVKEELRKRLTEQRQSIQFRDYMQKAESAAKTDVRLKF